MLLAGAAPVATPIGTAFERLDRGHLVPASLPSDATRVAVYYGAGWCGPCRAFVPELAAAYPRLRARGIEVVFVSDDAGCATARDYARTSRMPWLVLPCDPARRSRLRALAGAALPGIVVLDRSGAVRANSWRASGDSAPRRTLAALLE